MTYTNLFTNDLQYRNIEGSTAQILIPKLENESGSVEMSIANIHSSNSVYVDLYFSKDTREDAEISREINELDGSIDFTPQEITSEDYYLFKNLEITIGNAVILDKTDLFIYRNDLYDLMIKLNTSDGHVNVILKQDIK